MDDQGDSDDSIELTNENVKQIFNSLSSDKNKGQTDTTPESDPRLVILEQPQTQGFRFRYKCEGPSHGGLQGVHSQKTKRTYPTVQILNYEGPALIVVTLVTNDSVPRLHVHELVGKDCTKGNCIIQIPSAKNPICKLQNLAIMHVTKRKVFDILKEHLLESMCLEKRIESGNVNDTTININDEDKAKAEKLAKEQAKNMPLNVVRLNFQAYLFSNIDNKFSIQLPSVVSNPIFDSKSLHVTNLKIIRMDKYSGYCTGKEEVYLLCDRIQRDDIRVVFSENENSPEQWRALADFGTTDIHKQYAIVFKTPPYHNVHISKPIQVNIRLEKPSNNEMSDAIIFTYYPKGSDDYEVSFKKIKPLINIDDQPASNSDDDNLEDTTSHENADIAYPINDIELSEQQNKTYHNLNLNSANNCDTNTYSKEFSEALCEEPVKTDAAVYYPDCNSSHTTSTPDVSDYESEPEDCLQALRQFAKTGNSEELFSCHSQFMSVPDNNGNILLHLAVINNQVEIAKCLLKLLSVTPYDIDYRNSNLQSCLHLATELNRVSIVQLLLDSGANPTLVDSAGNNPLHLAVIYNNMVCLKQLLQPIHTDSWNEKINKCMKTHNKEGFTPKDVALNCQNMGAISLLESLHKIIEDTALEEPSSWKIYEDNLDMYSNIEEKTFSSIQETECFKGDMYEFPDEIRDKISLMLDSEDFVMNWRDLASHLDLIYIIDEASHFESPTKVVLDIFESHDGCIKDIYEALLMMKRYDALDIFIENGFIF
ncbi:nuclear factor NF-kappa-B p105 subunit-like isoform X2 [Argonauta hians]